MRRQDGDGGRGDRPGGPHQPAEVDEVLAGVLSRRALSRHLSTKAGTSVVGLVIGDRWGVGVGVAVDECGPA